MSDPAELISSDPWASSLGLEVVESGQGSATVRMQLLNEHMNFLDGAHGGALYTVAEAAIRAAAAGSGVSASVHDVHLALVAGAGLGDVFTARAERLAGSRALATYRVVVERGDGRVVGTATAVVRNEA